MRAVTPATPLSAEVAAEAGADAACGAAELDRLLEETSRTFALSIPLLEEPTRHQVTLAYLLFRIADTFEDAETWPRERRVRALGEFARLLAEPGADAVPRKAASRTTRAAVEDWLRDPPSSHAGYLHLLAATPGVLAAYRELDDRSREIVRVHTRRTAEGMASFVERGSAGGRLELATLDDLVAYCYVVAGIVGEMLTELFLLAAPSLGPVEGFLRQRAARFGEALQLVNILKDSAGDAVQGRRYLPGGLARDEVFARARRDLETAADYVRALHRHDAPRGTVAFTALPVLLARASLDEVESRGPGAKISRPTVFSLAARLEADLDAGRAPV